MLVLEVAFDAQERLTLSIRAVLGEVILVVPARAYAESRNREAGPARIEIDDAGGGSAVVWRHTCTAEADGAAVRSGVSQVGGLADSIRPTLVEDYYLKGVNLA